MESDQSGVVYVSWAHAKKHDILRPFTAGWDLVIGSKERVGRDLVWYTRDCRISQWVACVTVTVGGGRFGSCGVGREQCMFQGMNARKRRGRERRVFFGRYRLYLA